MNRILLALPALGCIVGMPLMMAVMMRGSRKETGPSSDKTAKLRAEVDQLRDELSQRDDATR